jgi:alpha,alpha-trehalase
MSRPGATSPAAERGEDVAAGQPAVRGPWLLAWEGFDPERERLREALCVTGNGYFATRGAAPEASADDVHYPGTYVAGVFNRLGSELGGHWIENESMVNAPNWLPLTFRIDGGSWFGIAEVELIDYEQQLDLRQGVLSRDLRFRDADGRHTAVTQRRFASMADPHLAALEMTIRAEDWSGLVEVRSGIDGGVVNGGVERYRDLPARHLTDVETGAPAPGVIELRARTTQSRILIAEAARTSVHLDGQRVDAEWQVAREPESVEGSIHLRLGEGQEATVHKIVGLYTSRDAGISEPAFAARRALEGAEAFPELLGAHVMRWDQIWERAELRLTEGERGACILNLHVFHLLQTVSQHSIGRDVGMPARGLHGEAYRGHIFWDELFAFPFLTLHLPELSRSLLLYRCRRLPEARTAAREAGYAGAMFPWQSGSDGREETQVVHLNPRSGRWLPDHSHRQRHINIAVAHNLWHYYTATGDIEFLAAYGAEALLEIARFWASIASYDGARERYVITGVMGPDEYHDAYPGADEPGVDNNAYTNVMAAWVLARALEVLEELPAQRRGQLREQLRLDRPELGRWEEISDRMFVPFHGQIISQFEGYEDLEEFDWEGYRRRYGNIQRLDRILEAEGDSTNRYKASKQADVLMLFYLLSAEELVGLLARLGYRFDSQALAANIDYYLARTSDGSTLSRVVHSWVLARSQRPESWQLFRAALESDIADVQGGTTQEGIHLGAMAGTVDLVQRGYTGLEQRDEVLWINPRLPREMSGLEFGLRFRRHWGIRVRIGDGRLRVSVPPSNAPPITIGFRDQLFELGAGETFEAPL